MTKIARPIAASAPATVKTKIAKIWPTKSCKNAEKATKLMLIESNISSIDIKSAITFLRFKKMPLTPMQKRIADNVMKCDNSSPFIFFIN